MLLLILFIIYAGLIFFIKEYYGLAIIFIINIMLMAILRINANKTILFCLKMLPFILFTVVINLLLSNIEFAILVGIRLILVCHITFIFSEKMTPRRLQKSVEGLCFPLKIFRVNPKDVGIIVSMGIAFIPILQKEIENLKYSLKAKGFKTNLRNLVTKPNYIILPLMTSIIKRTAEIEQSMSSKGYVG